MYTSSTSTTRGYVYTTNLAVGTLPCAENSYWLVSIFKILTLFHFYETKFETNICTNTVGSYYCRCNPGYESRYDENALDYFSAKDTTNINPSWEKMNEGMGRFPNQDF